MTLVVGIDPSAKKIALVASHEVLLTIHALALPLYAKGTTRQTPESLGKALDDMEQFLLWADQVAPSGSTRRCAWVENPLVGRGGVTATTKQAFVGGVIRAVLFNAGFEVFEVNVSTWKREVCGSGRAQKPAIKQTVKQVWPKAYGLVEHDGDLVDAAAINRYGAAILARERAITDSASRTEGASVLG